jgi:predicted ArsR family transcriptional regulator
MPEYRKGKVRLEGTRERIIRLLRAEPKSVDQLASVLGITLNAVRSQLAILERDGLVQLVGERRGPRRPSLIYGLTSESGRLLSRAYAPALRAILEAISLKSTAEDVEAILRDAGRRLAAEFGRPSGDFHTRVAKALDLLEGLGGSVEAEEAEGKVIIRGHGCPLAEAVEVEPRTCKCIETFLAELTGVQVEEQCERGKNQRCAFVISPGEAGSHDAEPTNIGDLHSPGLGEGIFV